jgi:hypothetical protein
MGQNNFYTPTNQLGLISTPLTGTELIRVYQGPVFKKALYANLVNSTINTISTAGAASISAFALNSAGPSLTQAVVVMTGTLGAGATLTLPTVAHLVATLGANFTAGMTWILKVVNVSSANFAWTLTTATGWGALGGTLTIGQNASRDFLMTLTSATAGTVQSIT